MVADAVRAIAAARQFCTSHRGRSHENVRAIVAREETARIFDESPLFISVMQVLQKLISQV